MFNVVKDGQIIATEATDAEGSIIVPNVTEGMYAFLRCLYLPLMPNCSILLSHMWIRLLWTVVALLPSQR